VTSTFVGDMAPWRSARARPLTSPPVVALVHGCAPHLANASGPAPPNCLAIYGVSFFPSVPALAAGTCEPSWPASSTCPMLRSIRRLDREALEDCVLRTS